MASVAGSQASSAASKPQRILACVLCQHRKIKCDRHFPCQNCAKANVKCTPSTPAPARKRRRPNQDLQERLARCEELLKEYATEKTESPTRPQASLCDNPYLNMRPMGKLVKEDGSVRFMDNFMLSTVCEELRAMREIVDADENNDEATPETTTTDDNSDLLIGGGDSPTQSADELWPDAGRAFRLWQMFLDRVNPLTKIIHVPTLQPYLVEATTGAHPIPKNIEALLFSIFLMAVVALSQEECENMLGLSKEQALQRYSRGVRISLQRIGFLKSHDLTILQALVIYLISLQGRYNRHASWILNGVVIRIAQKMGLHRDGELLGLSPFESEMRRRVWWQIIMVDAKYAMLSGLSHAMLPRGWDTKEPRNVNDADLFPSATEPFQDREGPTEMIFCLMTYKFAKFMVQTPGLDTIIMTDGLASRNSGMNYSLFEGYRRTLEALGNDLLALLDKYCDPAAGPIHQMTMEVKGNIFQKLQSVVQHSRLPVSGESEAKTVTDNAFNIAVSAFEHNERTYKSTMDKGFLWFSKTHFQTDIFMYMAGQLCHRLEGELVQRAWRQVEVCYSFHVELLDVSNKSYFTIAAFVLKAWNKREELFHNKGQLLEVPEYIEKLRSLMPDDYKSDSTPLDSVPSSSDGLTLSSPEKDEDPAALDQVLNNYLDVSAFDWEMFENVDGGSLNTGGLNNGGIVGRQPATYFAVPPFGMAPSAEW